MIRALTLAAALCALASCGSILGPSQDDLDAAVHDFYARGETANAPDLSTAHIAAYEGCQPRGGVFTCPVVFSTEQGNVSIMIWVVRTTSGGWEVRNLRLNERRR
ncbi:MAG: hypothetical protein NT015_08115 [Alphaproteobacteria bacterium]|nr:hypothetical protein [Alphaproteobacteria bacterium]